LGTIGNSTPFEVGSMSIANDGSGAGTVTVGEIFGGSPYYNDANQISGNFPVTVPQTLALAAPVPEPGTLILLGAGLGGLAAFVRARHQRV
jgi:hypothetical protein